MSAIAMSGVSKDFGDVTAVDDLDLSVRSGEAYALIGPNGSGKSTVLNLLLDFIRPTEGTITVFDRDVRTESSAVRQLIGVVPEGDAVYDRLTGREHLEFVAASRGVDGDIDDLLDRVDLATDADRAAGGYSSGMKKRLGLAMALLGEPPLLVLDEPFGGLDPEASLALRETLVEENERGTTVLMASHLLVQVEAICARVGLLLDGTLVAEDTVDAIRSAGDGTTLRVRVDDPERAVAVIRDHHDVSADLVDGSTVEVSGENGRSAEVLGTLVEDGLSILGVARREAPIEELFLAHAGDRR